MNLRNSYPGYNSNFGNADYDISRGAKDNQLECLKKFGKASLVPYPHPETLEWIVASLAIKKMLSLLSISTTGTTNN